jgi:MoaA/NifB/PqqE/SkfB family radical SAM enzyme
VELRLVPERRTLESPDKTLPARKLNQLIDYPPRPFSSIEVETSTHCSMLCPSCARTTYQDAWLNQHMSMEHFTAAATCFDHFETVLFRGWGQPQINPDFPEMVRLAYQSGARLVLSTNGFPPIPEDILPYFDSIIFRLDYGRAATYERRNPGVRLGRAIMNISRIIKLRADQNTRHPQVVLLFVRSKYSLREMPTYLDTALRIRPDRVIFYRPFFHVRGIDAQGELPADVDEGLIRRIDRKIMAKAEESGLEVVNQSGSRGCSTGKPCDCEPGRSMFIGWNGKLALCRYQALPLATGEFIRFHPSSSVISRIQWVGNLTKTPFYEILRQKPYRQAIRACKDKRIGRLQGRRQTCRHEDGKVTFLDFPSSMPASGPRDHR